MFLTLLAGRWRLILEVAGIVIALIVISVVMIQRNHARNQRDALQVFKTEAEALGRLAQAKAKATEKTQKEITADVAKGYEARIAAIRKHYGGLRQPDSGGGGVRSFPEAAAVANAAAADPVFAGICAETTQQLIDLQSWINLQGSVK
jgi:hypothetical protein